MNGLKDRGTALENKWAREQDAIAIAKLKASTAPATTKTETGRDKKKS